MVLLPLWIWQIIITNLIECQETRVYIVLLGFLAYVLLIAPARSAPAVLLALAGLIFVVLVRLILVLLLWPLAQLGRLILFGLRVLGTEPSQTGEPRPVLLQTDLPPLTVVHPSPSTPPPQPAE